MTMIIGRRKENHTTDISFLTRPFGPDACAEAFINSDLNTHPNGGFIIYLLYSFSTSH